MLSGYYQGGCRTFCSKKSNRNVFSIYKSTIWNIKKCQNVKIRPICIYSINKIRKSKYLCMIIIHLYKDQISLTSNFEKITEQIHTDTVPLILDNFTVIKLTARLESFRSLKLSNFNWRVLGYQNSQNWRVLMALKMLKTESFRALKLSNLAMSSA